MHELTRNLPWGTSSSSGHLQLVLHILQDLCFSKVALGCRSQVLCSVVFICVRTVVMVATQRSVEDYICLRFVACRCTSSDSLRKFRLTTTVYDVTWDLFAFAGYSTASVLGGGAVVVAFRGTDSHSLYNWVENMRYWKTDYDIPYPGSEGALVHTGDFCKLHQHPPSLPLGGFLHLTPCS